MSWQNWAVAARENSEADQFVEAWYESNIGQVSTQPKRVRLILVLLSLLFFFIALPTLLGTDAIGLVDDPCRHKDLSPDLGYFFVHGDYEQAVAEFTQALKLVPTCANLYWSLGDAYLQLGQSNEALTQYHHYLELSGNEADPTVIEVVFELEGTNADRTVADVSP